MTETPDRRRMARLSIPRQLGGLALEPQTVRVLDLSLGGVRIEHLAPLREGTSCLVELPDALGHAKINGRIIWTALRGGEQTLDGERRLHYQSGVAFATLTAEQAAELSDAMDTLHLMHEEQERKASA